MPADEAARRAPTLVLKRYRRSFGAARFDEQ
jgi:hypothetical protein